MCEGASKQSPDPMNSTTSYWKATDVDLDHLRHLTDDPIYVHINGQI